MIKITKNNQQKGAALLISLIIILTISVFVSAGLTFLTLNSAASAQSKIKSTKSYYLAEAGIEDILLRLKNSMQVSSPNTLVVGSDSAIVEITDPIGGSRTITSQGNADNRIKKLAITYHITSDSVSFHYGAQAGEGGILMNFNSQILGNVFSNGSISGSGTITETVTVANNGNNVSGIDIDGDVYTHSCFNADIDGVLHYVSGGTVDNCDYSNLEILENEIEPEGMPISQSQITKWKDDATAGGVISGDYVLSSNQSSSLGPIKITGNMILQNNATLIITGTIYVQGNITTQNNITVKLDSILGSNSGIIINDGRIIIGNNINVYGTGQEGSYPMFLSTNNSLDLGNPAIDLNNNAEGAIFYASDGVIYLHNNVSVKEVTGYKLALDNNAEIIYETGLANVNFSSGPGGSWQVSNWREIE